MTNEVALLQNSGLNYLAKELFAKKLGTDLSVDQYRVTVTNEDLQRCRCFGSSFRVRRGEKIALVGHEPWMGELLALLVLGEPEKGFLFHFKKGAVAHLTGMATAGGAELLSLTDPKVLRAAAR